MVLTTHIIRHNNEILSNYSLIDYFLCSPTLFDSNVYNQILDHDENLSDHLAIMYNFVSNITIHDQNIKDCMPSKYRWEMQILMCIVKFYVTLCHMLLYLSMHYCARNMTVRGIVQWSARIVLH